MTDLAINGAAGRMGRRLVALAAEDSQLNLVAASDAAVSNRTGLDAGELAGVGELGVEITASLNGGAEPKNTPAVVIDFSQPQGTRHAIDWCVEHQVALVIGTTGLTGDDQSAIDAAGQSIAVLQASNFSLVVNVLRALAVQATKMLGPDFDIELLESHHRFKADAPSGTALTLARALADAAGRDFDNDVVYARHGQAKRQPGEIGIQALRLGDVPGEHTVHFGALGERLELKHVSTSRDSYVTGALHAARWLAPQGPARYTMDDVLGLS